MRRSIFFLLIFVLPVVATAQKQDTVKHTVKRQWVLSPDYSEEITIPLDTVFSLFHRLKIADKYSAFNAYPGNYGLPLYQINFFDRVTDPDMYLYRYYYPFMHLPSNQKFFNTQVPYTELVFTYAGPADRADQTFRVSHSQNVNKKLNVGLAYDIVYSLGHYSYQRSEDKTFTLYSSYKGTRYNFYIGAGINNITSVENGGIKDTASMASLNTKDIVVNLGPLNKAKTVLKNRNLLIVQKFSVSRQPVITMDSLVKKNEKRKFRMEGTFSHILTWEINKNYYTDASPASGFYDSIYIFKDHTFDSLSVRSLKNTIRFDFSTDETRKVRLGGGFGVRNELFRYSQILPGDSLLRADTAVWRNSNNVLVGRLFNDIGNKFRWVATGELYFSGYRAGDFILDGKLIKTFSFKKGQADLNIYGKITNLQPSLWYERWGSNNFKWTNNFQKEFRINVGGEFSYPARRMLIRYNNAVIKNYTDFGLDALPSQYDKTVSVTSFYLRKEVSAWKLHLANDLLIQKSTNQDILDLPLVAVKTAGFFEHNFYFKATKGNLNTQIGAEVFYNTPYYGYSYMPATGVYYRQDKKLIGDYPYINVFVNVKLKRTRIFIMFDHINAGKMGYDYFMVPANPMNVRMFKYGLAWTFYD
jgi:hypothetical protein